MSGLIKREEMSHVVDIKQKKGTSYSLRWREQRKGQTKYFSFSVYGSTQKAWDAAVKYQKLVDKQFPNGHEVLMGTGKIRLSDL